jgi:hypothetical protein
LPVICAHAVSAIDGSKFKAVNTRDRNFTKAKLKKRMEQVAASIERHMAALETAVRQEGELAQAKSIRLKDKIATLRDQMRAFKALEPVMQAAPDQQLSLTDPDARSMATSGRGSGIVGYNLQAAVNAQHHLVVAHEATNVGNDRAQLANMSGQAKAAIGADRLMYWLTAATPAARKLGLASSLASRPTCPSRYPLRVKRNLSSATLRRSA